MHHSNDQLDHFSAEQSALCLTFKKKHCTLAVVDDIVGCFSVLTLFGRVQSTAWREAAWTDRPSFQGS